VYSIKGAISANGEKERKKNGRINEGNVTPDIVRRVNKRAHLPSNYEILNEHAGWRVQKT